MTKFARRFNEVRRSMENYKAKLMLDFEVEQSFEEKLNIVMRLLEKLKEYAPVDVQRECDEALEQLKDLREDKLERIKGLKAVRKEVSKECSKFSSLDCNGEKVILSHLSAVTAAAFAVKNGVDGVRWVRGRSIRSVVEWDAFDNLKESLDLEVEDPPPDLVEDQDLEDEDLEDQPFNDQDLPFVFPFDHLFKNLYNYYSKNTIRDVASILSVEAILQFIISQLMSEVRPSETVYSSFHTLSLETNSQI